MLSSALSQSWTTIEKNELDRRSQRKKSIQKQPLKLAFLMKPKTGTAGGTWSAHNCCQWTQRSCFKDKQNWEIYSRNLQIFCFEHVSWQMLADKGWYSGSKIGSTQALHHAKAREKLIFHRLSELERGRRFEPMRLSLRKHAGTMQPSRLPRFVVVCVLRQRGWDWQRMIFGVENRIDTGIILYKSPWKTDLTVILLESCEARKN